MAKTSLKVKHASKPMFSTRAFTRCQVCFRGLVYQWQIPGIRKTSWYEVYNYDNRSNKQYVNN